MNIKISNIFFIIFTCLFLIISVCYAEEAVTEPRMTTEYIVPQREIIVSPYVSYIFAKDLYAGFIDDQSGFGAGLDIRNQIYGNFGFILDAVWTNLKITELDNQLFSEEENENDLVMLFSGGFYYIILEKWKIDICYGAITAGNNIMTIFIPSVEYIIPLSQLLSVQQLLPISQFIPISVSQRFYIFAKLSYLITNDWIVDEKYEEHYTSFALTGGISVKF